MFGYFPHDEKSVAIDEANRLREEGQLAEAAMVLEKFLSKNHNAKGVDTLLAEIHEQIAEEERILDLERQMKEAERLEKIREQERLEQERAELMNNAELYRTLLIEQRRTIPDYTIVQRLESDIPQPAIQWEHCRLNKGAIEGQLTIVLTHYPVTGQPQSILDNGFDGSEDVVSVLDNMIAQLGARGWEMISVERSDPQFNEYWFKRRIERD